MWTTIWSLFKTSVKAKPKPKLVIPQAKICGEAITEEPVIIYWSCTQTTAITCDHLLIQRTNDCRIQSKTRSWQSYETVLKLQIEIKVQIQSCRADNQRCVSPCPVTCGFYMFTNTVDSTYDESTGRTRGYDHYKELGQSVIGTTMWSQTFQPWSCRFETFPVPVHLSLQLFPPSSKILSAPLTDWLTDRHKQTLTKHTKFNFNPRTNLICLFSYFVSVKHLKIYYVWVC